MRPPKRSKKPSSVYVFEKAGTLGPSFLGASGFLRTSGQYARTRPSLGSRRRFPSVILRIVVSPALDKTEIDASLPAEFTLQLGPHSSAQVAAMARILEELGARVERDAEGGLVAVRPA